MFDDAIWLVVVWHCLDFLGVQVVTHFFQYFVAELLPLIWHQLMWKSIMPRVIVIEVFGNGDCSFVINLIGLHMMRELICPQQELLLLKVLPWCSLLSPIPVGQHAPSPWAHSVMLHNGSLVSFLSKILHFSVEYVVHHLHPHLWPPKVFLQQGIGPILSLMSSVMMTQVNHCLALISWHDEQQHTHCTVFWCISQEQ